MKMGFKSWVHSLLLCCWAVVALAGAAQAKEVKEVKLRGAVYSPEPGVICDKKAGFCADSEGLAVALTKMYLGDKAEKRLMDRIRPEAGVQNYDTCSFVLTNGVPCDCKAKSCKVSKYEDKLDAAHTKALFGK